MNGYWNSLRPMEKRLVVGVGTMVVILLMRKNNSS